MWPVAECESNQREGQLQLSRSAWTMISLACYFCMLEIGPAEASAWKKGGKRPASPPLPVDVALC